MPKVTRYTPEQIVSKLREAKVVISKSYSAAAAARRIGVAEQTFYRWRRYFNTVYRHSLLGYVPPAPETNQPWSFSLTAFQRTSGAGLKATSTLT